MANRAKHAFGELSRVDEAIASGALNEYDILFVKDENGKPRVGWIDKDGNKVICDSSAEIDALKEELEATIEDKVSEVASYEVVEF